MSPITALRVRPLCAQYWSSFSRTALPSVIEIRVLPVPTAIFSPSKRNKTNGAIWYSTIQHFRATSSKNIRTGSGSRVGTPWGGDAVRPTLRDGLPPHDLTSQQQANGVGSALRAARAIARTSQRPSQGLTEGTGGGVRLTCRRLRGSQPSALAVPPNGHASRSRSLRSLLHWRDLTTRRTKPPEARNDSQACFCPTFGRDCPQEAPESPRHPKQTRVGGTTTAGKCALPTWIRRPSNRPR